MFYRAPTRPQRVNGGVRLQYYGIRRGLVQHTLCRFLPSPTLVSRYLILYCVFIGFCENCYFICLQMCVCVYMLTSISPSAASPFAYPSAIERNTTNPLGNYATRPMHTCSRLPPHRPLLCRRPRLLWKRVTSITEDIFAQCVHPSVCTCIHIPF